MSFFDQIKTYKKVLLSHEYHEMCDRLINGTWKLNQSSANYDIKKVFWGANLTEDTFFKDFVFSKIKKLIGENYTIEYILGNAQSSLQPASPHMDNINPGAYTFILYANKKWDYTWGGQTLFFNRYWDTESNSAKIASEEEHEFKCVFPIPNTAVLFPANIMHYAEAPTRDYYGMRFSVAFKLYKQL